MDISRKVKMKIRNSGTSRISNHTCSFYTAYTRSFYIFNCDKSSCSYLYTKIAHHSLSYSWSIGSWKSNWRTK